MNIGLLPNQPQRLIPMPEAHKEKAGDKAKRTITKRKRKTQVRTKQDVLTGRGKKRNCVKPCKKKFGKAKVNQKAKPKARKQKR